MGGVRFHLTYLVLLVIIVRGGFAIAMLDNLDADPDAYGLIARGIAAGGGVSTINPAGQTQPTAFRPPAYPWLLSWSVRDGELWRPGVAGLHVALAAATAALTFLVTERLTDRRGSLVRRGVGDHRAVAAVVVDLDNDRDARGHVGHRGVVGLAPRPASTLGHGGGGWVWF